MKNVKNKHFTKIYKKKTKELFFPLGRTQSSELLIVLKKFLREHNQVAT
jgi:hypothetical protein